MTTQTNNLDLIVEEAQVIADRHITFEGHNVIYDDISEEAMNLIGEIGYDLQLEDRGLRVDWDERLMYYDCQLYGMWGRE